MTGLIFIYKYKVLQAWAIMNQPLASAAEVEDFSYQLRSKCHCSCDILSWTHLCLQLRTTVLTQVLNVRAISSHNDCSVSRGTLASQVHDYSKISWQCWHLNQTKTNTPDAYKATFLEECPEMQF